MNKQHIIQNILGQLEQQLETMRKAAISTKEAATGDEAKSEGKYDTRGLEASYLAQAQADQYLKLEHAIKLLSHFSPEPACDDTVQVGSLVETEAEGIIKHYFLLPSAGGVTFDESGTEITTIAPDAPVYKALIGHKVGDLIELTDMIILDIV